jgi:N-acetylglucosamine malate deacetylase 1
MGINALRDRILNKIHWLYTRQWPILVSQLQYCGLMLTCRPIAISPKSALIISPHQDDETFGCGGVIALKRAQGVAVNVIFITDGSASHIWHPQFSQGEIAPVRQQEALTALKALGVEAEQVHFLNHRDGKLKWLDQDEHQQILDQLVQLIQAHAPAEIYVTHRYDRSNDHEITFNLVKTAIAVSGLHPELFEYAIWMLWKPMLFCDLTLQELAGACRLPIHPVLRQKQAALKAYRSQYLPIADGNSTVLPQGFLWRFNLPYEIFFQPDKKR